MLHAFLLQNEAEILAMTEQKTRALAGTGPTSEQLKRGLPIFYTQLMTVLQLEQGADSVDMADKGMVAKAAQDSDEPAMALASGHPNQVALAQSAGRHGSELQRLGYTLSHVVHAYGAMCQAITELATQKNVMITTTEFHDLNQCLDVAIAGAVTEYAFQQDAQASHREVKRLGFLAHELRNALNSVTIAYQLIKKGFVAPGGSTGHVVERGLARIDELVNRSLSEVRLQVEPKVSTETGSLLQIVDHIVLTAAVEAKARTQTLEIKIDPTLVVQADQQLFHSALSNLIQNAIKYTRMGGKIHVRGKLEADQIVIDVEDECGGLHKSNVDLFAAFAQQDSNRSGLGLGLTIARRAIELNGGTIMVQDLPGKGCIFTITLPNTRTSNPPPRKPPTKTHGHDSVPSIH